MQDLTPAGLTEDGTCLLLVSTAGEKFLLPVDDQVQRLVGASRRSAVPADPASAAPRPTGPTPATPARRTTTPRQQEPTMDSALRPRDIQARVRAGESAETVAAAAGTSVEAIMPYASPVLAERAHQAQVALRASVRRGTGPAGGARALGDAVDQFLAGHRLDDSAVEWDSWRRQDGRWALTAQVDAGGRSLQAAFVHDVAGRYVVAENDDAKALIGEPVADAAGADAASGPDQPAARRLSSVSDAPARPRETDVAGVVAGVQDSLGDDAIALVRDRRDGPPVLDGARHDVARSDVDEPTVEVGADPSDAALEGAQPSDDDPIHQPADVQIHGLGGSTDDTSPGDETPLETADVAVDAPATPAPELDEPRTDGPDDQPALDLGVAAPDVVEEQDRPRRGRKGRASVPSWDEIMFGGGGASGSSRGDDPDQDRPGTRD